MLTLEDPVLFLPSSLKGLANRVPVPLWPPPKLQTYCLEHFDARMPDWEPGGRLIAHDHALSLANSFSPLEIPHPTPADCVHRGFLFESYLRGVAYKR